ncbi:MAG: ABC transporter permease subunit [Clostridiales bacterium]|nr:ABC transporter permease subunit [Clostridiales bacterium]
MRSIINPVYKKELKLNMRTWKTAIFVMLYNLFLAGISLLAYYLTIDMADYSSFSYSILLNVFRGMMTLEYALVLFLVPSYTSGAISGERERQTLEILLTTKMKPFQIVIGKLLSSISLIILLVISSLPILSIIFSIGGASVIELLKLILMCITSAIYIGSFGILFSTLFKRTMPATVITYLMIVFLCFGTLVITLVAYALDHQNHYDVDNYVATAGPFAYLLLFNPLISYVDFIFGGYHENWILGITIGELCKKTPAFLQNHWGLFATVCQMALSLLVLLFAARKLNPTHYQNKKKQKKARKAQKKMGHAGVEGSVSE